MSLVSYDVTIKPSEPSVSISIQSISGTTMTVQLDSIGDFSLLLEPSTNVDNIALSSIVWPVAQLIALAIPSQVKNELNGETFTQDFGDPIGYSFCVDDIDVKVQAQELNLSNYNGMLMAKGTVTVS